MVVQVALSIFRRVATMRLGSRCDSCTLNRYALLDCRSRAKRRVAAAVYRRETLLLGVSAPLVVLSVNDDAVLIANSILSGYGLPLLAKTKGFKTYDEFKNSYMLQYPKSWVLRYFSARDG